MRHFFLLLLIFSGIYPGTAQEEEEDLTDEQEEGWTREGSIALLFNQSAFNAEWTGGGTSNTAGNFLFNYDINYLKDNVTWDNRILIDYGLSYGQEDHFPRKTSDRFEINSIAGKEIDDSNWFYSLFLNFRTQLTKGYRFGTDEETGEPIRTEISHFMSPGFLQFGPGALWKKNENLYVNIAPATGRLVFVDPDFTSIANYVDGAYYGVQGGNAVRLELGTAISAYGKFNLIKNVRMENLLNLYSNYFENPQNVDIDYTLNLKMKINEYLTTNLIFQAIYDDETVSAFQIREVLGVGFNYTL